MKSRAVLVAGLAAMLIFPFACLAWWVLYSSTQPRGPKEIKISPVLTDDQRKNLRTYYRRCRTAADCEPPLGCLYDLRFRYNYCSDSECVTDRQCPEGQVCRVLATFKGPWLKQCVMLGDRKEARGCPPGQECMRSEKDGASTSPLHWRKRLASHGLQRHVDVRGLLHGQHLPQPEAQRREVEAISWSAPGQDWPERRE